jgi:hypothetical protein
MSCDFNVSRAVLYSKMVYERYPLATFLGSATYPLPGNGQ